MGVGDEIVSIDGEVPRDVIQWQMLVDEPDPEIVIDSGGLERTCEVEKVAGEPLVVQGQEAVDLALEKNPLSLVLLAEQRRVAAAIDQYRYQQQLQLAILRASYIPQEKALLNNIQRAQPGAAVIDTLREQGRQSRAMLWRQAQRQRAKEQWTAALATVKLVNKLDQTAASAALQRALEAHLSEQRQRQQQHLRNEKIDTLVAAVNSGDLIAAEIIAQEFGDNNRDQRLQQALALLQLKIARSAHYVQLLIDSGQQYYTEGLLDRAVFSWQQAAKLDPDNRELELLLQRALLFQSNYRKLQDSRR